MNVSVRIQHVCPAVLPGSQSLATHVVVLIHFPWHSSTVDTLCGVPKYPWASSVRVQQTKFSATQNDCVNDVHDISMHSSGIQTRCSAIAERPRYSVRYRFGQKWKTGNGRQYSKQTDTWFFVQVCNTPTVWNECCRNASEIFIKRRCDLQNSQRRWKLKDIDRHRN